jgi:hypothetical protein
MADNEIEVERLAVSLFETGADRNRQQLVKVEFTAIKTQPPPTQRETWEIEVPFAIIEAIRELQRQYEYSLGEPGAVKDLVFENPFRIEVQRP